MSNVYYHMIYSYTFGELNFKFLSDEYPGRVTEKSLDTITKSWIHDALGKSSAFSFELVAWTFWEMTVANKYAWLGISQNIGNPVCKLVWLIKFQISEYCELLLARTSCRCSPLGQLLLDKILLMNPGSEISLPMNFLL